ncbi:hypothetical protein [Kitasatospora sp. NPDC094011]|uniref:hypothetical protein n=1 Tax=Kitasatospora sp. NPDC094011 TaxID=3364090 RepID=UPI003809A725
MPNHLEEALAVHGEALAAWRECRAKAQQIKDPKERAAALKTLAGERPVHPYFGGISLAAVGRGSRQMLAPVRARHADARAEHAETLAEWKKRRTAARQIKDAEQRTKALDEIGERPTHPALVAIGCAVVGTAVLSGIPAVRQHTGAIIGGGLALWVIAALILGSNTASQTPRQASAEAADEAPIGEPDEGHQEEPEHTAPTPAQTHALAASFAADRTSVLLTQLASDLAADHPDWEASTKAVRTLLTAAGIPVRGGVRTPDGNGPGVHHEDVPPLPSPSAPTPAADVVANVGAGQSANANANNTSATPGGEEFVLQPHPTDPARTIVVHHTSAA